MEPYDENNASGNESSGHTKANRWLIVALIALLVMAGFAMSYGVHQQGLVQQLKDQAATTNATMNQLETQVSTLTSKLNDMTAAQAAAADAATKGTPGSADTSGAGNGKSASAKRVSTKKRAVVDKRYSQLKAQLDEQGKQLKETQDLVAKNRTDLEGNISSTRDELNGSIARTHEELVVLQKRGERSYTEFDLMKSKQFQRIGPMTLSLRKTDTKHKSYDLALVVDDNELSKKKVNLYEPIWIHTESGGQPIQIVVNRIDKNLIHGYVSAPKYKQSELANANFSGTTPPASNSSQPTTQPPQQ
jgi:uncharacterized coiled-coil protein SlyX